MSVQSAATVLNQFRAWVEEAHRITLNQMTDLQLGGQLREFKQEARANAAYFYCLRKLDELTSEASQVDASLGVYLVDEEYWFVAPSPEDALEQYLDITGADELTIDDVSLVTDDELHELTYTEDETTTRSFFAQAEKLKAEGRWVRGVFAVVQH